MKLARLPGSILQKENYMMQHILDRIASVTPLDTAAMELARARQQQLTKPVGSLGRLEDIAIQMAGISKQRLPSVKQKAVIIMAGDHGVTREGVSAYPSAVTPQMVYNFLRGGAAINALAHQIGAKVIVVDVGVAADLSHPGLLSRKVAFGTANMVLERAMTHEQMLEAMRIPALGVPGFEADDLLATLAREAAERGMNVFLCTSDKDCRQLIDDRVYLYNLRKRTVLDREALQKDWGIRPEQVVDLQTLVGDSVDNVPGVPGIGLKTAARLLQEFGSIDEMLKCLEKVGGCKGLRGAKELMAQMPDMAGPGLG